MRIGLLTGGGDAPGLNGIIEAVSKTLLPQGVKLFGIHDGFEGIFENRVTELTWEEVEGCHARAGTLLGTTNRCGTEGREDEFLEKFKALKLDGLIAAGGDGTFRGLQSFREAVPLIGVPKTIDNDLPGTDVTFGYDTACSVVAESVDALRATADAHSRVIFVETMGRTAGWIALGGGMASFAEVILLPERPFDLKDLQEFMRSKKDSGVRGLVCVVSEGAHTKDGKAFVRFNVEGSPQAERLGGIAEHLARWSEEATGWEGRHVVLGHLQRSKAPTTTDRFLTLAMGVKVGQLVKNKEWGQAVVYRDGLVQSAPIADVMGPARLVDKDHRWVKMCQAVGSFI